MEVSQPTRGLDSPLRDDLPEASRSRMVEVPSICHSRGDRAPRHTSAASDLAGVDDQRLSEGLATSRCRELFPRTRSVGCYKCASVLCALWLETVADEISLGAQLSQGCSSLRKARLAIDDRCRSIRFVD